MATSEARAEANRKNAQHSTGPKTEAGKARSRRNALKHGLTAEVVIPQEEAAEVERKFQVMKAEMKPSSELATELVHQIAASALRVRRCRLQEATHLTRRINEAMAEVVIPEGATPEEAAELRAEAADLALYDPSPEAERARRYEAAAHRSFFRAIHEFRRVEREPAPASAVEQTLKSMAPLGSFLKPGALDKLMEPKPGETIRKPPLAPSKPAEPGVSFVPIAVGKPR